MDDNTNQFNNFVFSCLIAQQATSQLEFVIRLKTELRLLQNEDVTAVTKQKDRKVKIIHALLLFLIVLALLISISLMLSPYNRINDDTCSESQEFKKITFFTEGSFLLLVGIFDAVVFAILLRFISTNIV